MNVPALRFSRNTLLIPWNFPPQLAKLTPNIHLRLSPQTFKNVKEHRSASNIDYTRIALEVSCHCLDEDVFPRLGVAKDKATLPLSDFGEWLLLKTGESYSWTTERTRCVDERRIKSFCMSSFSLALKKNYVETLT